MRSLVICLILLLPTLLRSDADNRRIYLSEEGHQYEFSTNEHGAVLTSLYPVGRFVGTGAFVQTPIQVEILYLGQDCDAFSEILGDGTWGWANGGFALTFHSREIRFPHAEIDVPNGVKCQI